MSSSHEELFMCTRCGGLLAIELDIDEDGFLKMARCLICGDRFDEVVLTHRRLRSELVPEAKAYVSS